MLKNQLYPEIEPYHRGTLHVGSGHELVYEQCGNPHGVPVLFVHGGPGAGCSPADRRFFDPAYFRVVLFDQRGAGQSTPVGELQDNTIDHLVADIETLRTTLEIDQWHVFGGSWGSTLGLYYAQCHPQSCLSLVLRGIWLLREEEIDWWFYRTRFVQPEIWRAFAEHVPADERHDLLDAYWRRLNGSDRTAALAAARQWSVYEGSCCTLRPNPEYTARFAGDSFAWALARLEAHYFRQAQQRDLALLDNIERIRHLPAVIVHGRYDIVCPVKSADDLHRAWPEASLVIVPDAGHSSYEPGIAAELVAAMSRIRDTGRPNLPPT